MNHLSRTCPLQVLQQCLLNIGSNGQRWNSCLGRNHPVSTFPLIPQVLLIRLEGCVSYPRVTALASHIPPTILHKPHLQGWMGKTSQECTPELILISVPTGLILWLTTEKENRAQNPSRDRPPEHRGKSCLPPPRHHSNLSASKNV